MCLIGLSGWGCGVRCVERGCILAPAGCFVSGLYLEGAGWDLERGCLVRSQPKVLVVDLPILKVIPIESHRLKLQVRAWTHPDRGVARGLVQAAGEPPNWVPRM